MGVYKLEPRIQIILISKWFQSFKASCSREETSCFGEKFQILVLSYAKNISIRSAISSGKSEELQIIWQPQIKEKLSQSTFISIEAKWLKSKCDNKSNRKFLIFNKRELFSVQKRLTSPNLSATYQREPSTRPPRQLTILIVGSHRLITS